jgi:uncharacterized protein YndB with AHSA1/START domain
MKTKTKRQDIAVENDIVIQRVFKLPISKVWQALTVAENFKKWWGPGDYSCPYSTMEARKGGKYLNCMRGPDGKETWSTGVIQEFIPGEKLVLTDSFADSKGNIIDASDAGMSGEWPRELLITFELEEADGATKLTLTHEGVPEEMHDECVEGWNGCFDKLEKNIK